MTATTTAPDPQLLGVQRATAEYLLDQLDQLARGGMSVVEAAADQLAATLYPAPIPAPVPGEAVMVCGGCWRAVDRAELRWWPRPTGMATSLRVGCSGCVAGATDRLTRGYR